MSDFEQLCSDCDSPYHRRCTPKRSVTPDAVVEELAAIREGLRLRDEGTARVEDAVDVDWRERAEAAVDALIVEGQPFTAEEVCRIAGRPDRPNAVGALLLGAARRGAVRRVGYRPARRAERHGAVLAIWQAAP